MQKHQLHPNAPQSPQSTLNEDGSLTVSFDAVEGAKSYVIHYANANESDPHRAVFMGYTETNTWTLSKEDLPENKAGDKLYFYVQTFNDLGKGTNDIEKASYLNTNKLGSAWSEPTIITVPEGETK
ncbi:hypothetical protein [Enterococcus faecalis]|uniref:hypothetical protein n=1 Tax=Enterococcus faecalis TaxID=1351 RepID=UPI0004A3AC07|nr:hypothetical protein [Enterococcus faecalis]